jgi:hypothetical protein
MVTQPEPSVSSNGVQVGLEGEEIREVASQLGLTRKRPDAAKEYNIKKKALLERIKSEIKSLESFKETTAIPKDSRTIQACLSYLRMTALGRACLSYQRTYATSTSPFLRHKEFFGGYYEVRVEQRVVL